ncbi:MAG: ABC transporter ATP-binding protein [Actinobacteria bacterium]|nr:ABC transporter ATP-binding protein [Actinomycetota bacterium]MBU1610161.1 ABC transporter ATP-binding protein [Actinomycetota bacterium]MBU2316010.1 ABC transporter ATP-binding protein [Actinomycetota bacterium]MBU2383926.1 ABC transporter ATP-binding protein [Actinomycetota bacterium]
MREDSELITPAETPAVEVRGLKRTYGQTTALDSVHLSIGQGELVSLLGASGSGKSTLLRIIAGFDTPSAGQVLIGGQDSTRLSPAQRDVGMVFQNYALFPHMNVRSNIEYGLRMRRWRRKERADRVAEMLERMQLSELGDRLPAQLSGGQQQRVAIARALAFTPRLLLMDEPLGALDKSLREDMLQEIRRVHREFGSSILYVTHDREEALVLSDRIALMDRGVLRACEDVEDLYLRPATDFVARFIAGATILRQDDSAILRITLDAKGALVSIRNETFRLSTPPPSAGGPLGLAVRPSGHTIVDVEANGSITGVVDEKVFLGDHVRLVCTLPDFDASLNVVCSSADARLLVLGDRVGIKPSAESLSVVSLDEHADAVPSLVTAGHE